MRRRLRSRRYRLVGFLLFVGGDDVFSLTRTDNAIGLILIGALDSERRATIQKRCKSNAIDPCGRLRGPRAAVLPSLSRVATMMRDLVRNEHNRDNLSNSPFYPLGGKGTTFEIFFSKLTFAYSNATRNTINSNIHDVFCDGVRIPAKKEEFDIVLSDVHMRDIDGFKLFGPHPLDIDIPVLMMSANADQSVVLRGIIHGAVDYLLKPVRIHELKNIWRHVVRKKWDNSLQRSASMSMSPVERKSGEGLGDERDGSE